MRPLALKPQRLVGPDIAEVQRRLGFTGDDVDGVYGPKTAAAVEDWKWRIGYPEDQITSRLALPGQAWLLELEPLPPKFAAEAKKREGKERPTKSGIVLPLSSNPGFSSEFALRDPEGAPDAKGNKFHAAKDWFARGGTPVRAPVSGTVVEIKASRGNRGQIFGGVVKIEGADAQVWVLRHVDPSVADGERVEAGQLVASVTSWLDGASHVHIELWKTLAGGYKYENMSDPMELFK